MEGVPQWVRGVTSRQAHVGLPPGTVEEEHGRSGFFGPASHLYHRNAPTDWIAVEGPAAHHAYDTRRLQGCDDLWPTLLLGNHQLSIAWHRYEQGRAEFLRDADGDELFFVHAGDGRLRTEYGPLDYRTGDYLVVPRGTTYRFEPTAPTDLLVVEAYESRFRLPDKGLLGRHALFDPAMLEVPEAESVDEEGEFTVVVKRLGQDTRITYPFHPCDVIGWKGDVAPMRINVEDFRPVTSARYHLPPSAHTTFVADGFVVCTFAPRPLEEDPDALRLPFFHRNIDYDEVILYHRGEFFSRAGIDEGMLTWHPFGLHHGPQPGARARDAAAAAAAPTGERRMADEVAVMIDARHALVPGEAAKDLDVEGYIRSWSPDAVRLARYRSAHDQSIWVGIVTDELVTPIAHGDGRAGQDALLAAAMGRPTVPVEVGEPEPLDRVRLLTPIAEPPSIRDFYAFEAHVATARKSRGLEMEPDWYELPVFYFTNPAAVLGPDDEVRPPRATNELDYELEVAAVIGRDCADVPADRWLEVVAGFTVMDDWSARDLQRREMALSLGPAKGKDFGTSLGPVLVTPEELLDDQGVPRGAMMARVNGDEWSRGELADLHHDWGDLIAHASRDARLRPGDVIGSGTVGTGCILELGLVHGRDRFPYLVSGDEVELEVDGIGVLRNRVA